MRNTTTYQPDNSLRKGYFSIFKEIIIELSSNKWLMIQLFRRDFLTRYKQSLLGVLWALLVPMLAVGTFIILNFSGVLDVGEIDIPYPIYGLLSISIWQIFSVGIAATTSSLSSAGSLLTKINFSRKSLVVAAFGQTIISFVIQFIVVSALLVYYQYPPSFYYYFLPILLLPLILFTLGFGLFFALINAVVRDVSNVISVGMTFLLFVTPVLYEKPVGILGEISEFNPLYYLVTVPRDLALLGYSPYTITYLWVGAASFVLLLVTAIGFHLTETRISERI